MSRVYRIYHYYVLVQRSLQMLGEKWRFDEPLNKRKVANWRLEQRAPYSCHATARPAGTPHRFPDTALHVCQDLRVCQDLSVYILAPLPTVTLRRKGLLRWDKAATQLWHDPVTIK